MNLKEAFRYQNKIQALMCEAENILRNRANITKVTNTNLRHKVMPEASDETVVEIPETEYCGKITDVALFLVFLLEEKSALAAAIRRAKNNLDIDMDSEVALNSARQTVAEIFRTMNGIRSSEQTIANGGTGYRFNTDGNQVTELINDNHYVRHEAVSFFRIQLPVDEFRVIFLNITATGFTQQVVSAVHLYT